MNEGHQITVMIADDHTLVRQGLRALVEGQPDLKVVAEATNGSEAVDQFLEHRPDVSVIDLHMPVCDGVAAISTILSHAPDARIICLTSLNGDDFVYRAVRAGAKGYLMKAAPREDLFACIRAVRKGDTWLGLDVASKLADRVRQPRLNRREDEVLQLLAVAKSNKEIAVLLGIGAGTVKAHVNNILKKLEVTSRMEAVNLARRRGLILPE